MRTIVIMVRYRLPFQSGAASVGFSRQGWDRYLSCGRRRHPGERTAASGRRRQSDVISTCGGSDRGRCWRSFATGAGPRRTAFVSRGSYI
jgi:hypothetical protein